jgi:fatty-acyl-CoA synthase
MSKTVHDWVSYHARRTPAAPALTSVERDITLDWSTLDRRVGRLAAALTAGHGLTEGDRVALIAENDTRTFELQFACMRAGLIFVPLNWRLAMGEMIALARDAAPAMLIHDDIWQAAAEELAREAGITIRIGWSDTLEESAFDRMIDAEVGFLPGRHRGEDQVTHILYTSGTTGLPKGALCTLGTLKHHAVNTALTARLAEPGVHHFNVVPLFHAGGLNIMTNPALFWGGHVTTVRRFDPEVTLQALTDPQRAITNFCGVLQMYELMTALPDFARTSFPALRAALFGGWGPKTVPVHEAWQDRGFFLQLSYGSTEQGPNISILEDDQELARRNCSGRPLPGIEIRLVDDEGRDVAAGAVGEIWTRGASITPGYWKRPREDYFSGDWFRSGDCGRFDDSGNLYIVDRLREVYRSGGENIYPAEVELALASAPGVRDVAVIAVPDEKWGEVGIAVVEPETGANVTLEALLAHAEGRIARFKYPKQLTLIDAMPRNATLKIDRTDLKRRFGA